METLTATATPSEGLPNQRVEYSDEMRQRALTTGEFITQVANESLDAHVAAAHAQAAQLEADGKHGKSFVVRRMADMQKEAGIDKQLGYGHINKGRAAAHAAELADPTGPISLTDMSKTDKMLHQADTYKKFREQGDSDKGANASVDKLTADGYFDKFGRGTGR